MIRIVFRPIRLQPILFTLIMSMVCCSATRNVVINEQSNFNYVLDRLVIDMCVTADFTPSTETLEKFFYLVDAEHIASLDSITLIKRYVYETVPIIWDLQSIAMFERRYRNIWDDDTKDRDMYIFVSCIDGCIWSAHAKLKFIGGVQYTDSSFAVFKTGSGKRTPFVMLHELLHIIGLRKDSVNPRFHCPNTKCIMYTTAGKVLCSNCKKILKAMRTLRYK